MFNYDWVYKAALPNTPYADYTYHRDYRVACHFRDILMKLSIGDASPWVRVVFDKLIVDDDD